jgi:predicted nuclease of predicted toxin-antitoxin system
VRIIVDENIPTIRAEHLREISHEVADIRGTAEEGMSDEDLWRKAQKGKQLLITTDKGFARNRHEKHNGILVILLRWPNRHRITQRVTEAMQLFSLQEWPGLLVVMRNTVMSTWHAASEK